MAFANVYFSEYNHLDNTFAADAVMRVSDVAIATASRSSGDGHYEHRWSRRTKKIGRQGSQAGGANHVL